MPAHGNRFSVVLNPVKYEGTNVVDSCVIDQNEFLHVAEEPPETPKMVFNIACFVVGVLFFLAFWPDAVKFVALSVRLIGTIERESGLTF
jgi:hypothetical protein